MDIFFYKTLKFINLEKHTPEICGQFIFILKKCAPEDLEINCNLPFILRYNWFLNDTVYLIQLRSFFSNYFLQGEVHSELSNCAPSVQLVSDQCAPNLRIILEALLMFQIHWIVRNQHVLSKKPPAHPSFFDKTYGGPYLFD